jgi:hypothetical protein
LTGEVGAAEATDAHTGAWEVTTRGDGWRLETRYRLLRPR